MEHEFGEAVACGHETALYQMVTNASDTPCCVLAARRRTRRNVLYTNVISARFVDNETWRYLTAIHALPCNVTRRSVLVSSRVPNYDPNIHVFTRTAYTVIHLEGGHRLYVAGGEEEVLDVASVRAADPSGRWLANAPRSVQHGLQCGSCGAADRRLSFCSGCYRFAYCDRRCQAAHWKAHQRQCHQVKSSLQNVRNRILCPVCNMWMSHAAHYLRHLTLRHHVTRLVQQALEARTMQPLTSHGRHSR